MKLTFRQGIVRYQTDLVGMPVYLQISSQNRQYVDLVANPDPTIVIFAHKNATYVIQESRTVRQAWGPFNGNEVRYLYWDISLINAAVSRGSTKYPQIISNTEPVNPNIDQHWFDKNTHQMKVWNGSNWVERIRVFAGVLTSQSMIHPSPLGSQANEIGDFDGGNILLDDYNSPLRKQDGTFVTSSSSLGMVSVMSSRFTLESKDVVGMASENIPKFSLVQLDHNQTFKLARSTDWKTRIHGIATENIYESQVSQIKTTGLIKNDQWTWPESNIGKPLFCGPMGELTLVPPKVGVLQIVGYIFDKDSIYIDIKQATILSTSEMSTPNQPGGLAPVPAFTLSSTSGRIPLTVKATCVSSNNPTSWKWDFNNDGIIDSVSKDASFTYNTPGIYSVKLLVKNEFGEAELTKSNIITVLEKQSNESGINTNLSIQLNSSLQVQKSQTFSISILTINSGYLAGTNVYREIIVNDVNNSPVEPINLPEGFIATRGNKFTKIVLPNILSLSAGQNLTSSISFKAPDVIGNISIRGTVSSIETDIMPSDNVADIVIRIKQ